MGKTQNYWDRLLFSEELKKTEIYDTYKNDIEANFRNKTISAENLKGLKDKIMSFRLSQKVRAICVSVKNNEEYILVILKILENHNYSKVYKLNVASIIKKSLVNQSSIANNEIIDEEAEEDNKLITDFHNKKHLIHKSKFVTLDDNQSDILKSAIDSDNHLTLVVNGVAGSGKTTIAESIITRSNDKVLYVCKSINLVNEMKKLYSSYKTNIDFCTNEELYTEEIFNLDIFTSWFNCILKSSKDDKLLKYLDKQKDNLEEFVNKLKFNYANRYEISYEKVDHELRTILSMYLEKKICDDAEFSNWMLSGNNRKKYDNLINFDKQTLKALYEDIVKFKQSPQDFGKKISHEIFKEDNSDKPIDENLSVICNDYIKYLNNNELFDFQLGVNKAYKYNNNQNIKGKGKQKLVDLGDIKTDIDTNRKSNIKYKYILVDESQDLSYFELHNIRSKLLEHNGKIIYFTDDNQNIADTFSRTNHNINLVGEDFKDQKAICYNLDSSYRTPVKVTEFASKLLEIKAKLIGGNLNKHENKTSKAVLDSSIYKEGIVNWVYDTQKEDIDKIKQNLQNSIDCCLIVPDEEIKGEAKILFPKSIVFTPNEIKGLDYKNVILYKFFTGKYSNNEFLKNETVDKYNAREKIPENFPNNKEGTKYSVLMNKFYTSVTRSENSIVIFEEYKEDKLKIIESYKAIFIDLIDDKTVENLEKSTFRDVIDKLHSVWDKLPDEILLKYINKAYGLIDIEHYENNDKNLKDLQELKNIVQEINNIGVNTSILKDIPNKIDEKIDTFEKLNKNQINYEQSQAIKNEIYNLEIEKKEKIDIKGKKPIRSSYPEIHQGTLNQNNKNIATKTNYTADELIDKFKDIDEPEDLDKKKDFEKIITSNNKLLDDKIFYYKDLINKTKSKKEKAKILCHEAYIYYIKGKIGKAYKTYESSTKVLETFDAFNGMGKMWYIKKEYEEAKKLFKKAIKYDDINISAYYNISKIFIEKEDYLTAIEHSNEALKLFDNKTKKKNYIYFKKYIREFNEYLGYAYSKIGEYNKSVKYSKNGSDSNRNISTLAYSLLNIQDYKNSKKEYEKFFIKHKTEDPYIYYYYAICLYELLDYKKAIENLDIAIKLNNKLALFYEKKINCLIQLNELEEALKTCNALKESDSSNNSILISYTNKFYINFLKENFQSSIYCCNKILEYDNQNIYSLALRGIVNQLCNKKDEARLDYSSVAEQIENQNAENEYFQDERINDYLKIHYNYLNVIDNSIKHEPKLQKFLDQYEYINQEYIKILDIFERLKSENITYIFLDKNLPSIDIIRKNILNKTSIENILYNFNKLGNKLNEISMNSKLSSQEVIDNIYFVIKIFKESCLNSDSNELNLINKQNNYNFIPYQKEENNKDFEINIKQKNDIIIAPEDTEINNIEKFIYFYNIINDLGNHKHLEIIEKYIEYNLNFIKSEINIVDKKISDEKSNIEKANLYYIKASIYYIIKEYKESIQIFEDAIRIYKDSNGEEPELAKFYLGIAKSQIKLNLYDEADIKLQMVISTKKFLISAYTNYCWLSINFGSYFDINYNRITELQLEIVNKFKIDSNEFFDDNCYDYSCSKSDLEKKYLFATYDFLIYKCLKLEKYQIVIDLCKKYDSIVNLQCLADSYYYTKDYVLGMHAYEKFFDKYKVNDAEIFRRYSSCLGQCENYHQAICIIDMGLKINNITGIIANSTKELLYINKIIFLLSIGDFESATKTCYQFLSISLSDRSNTESLTMLGITKLFQCQYEESLKYYELILSNEKLKPDKLQINSLKAFTLKIIEQNDSADFLINSLCSTFENAINNNDPIPIAYVREYYELINNYEELIYESEKSELSEKINNVKKMNIFFIYMNNFINGLIVKKDSVDKIKSYLNYVYKESHDNNNEGDDANSREYRIDIVERFIELNSTLEKEIFDHLRNPNNINVNENLHELPSTVLNIDKDINNLNNDHKNLALDLVGECHIDN